MEDLEDGKIDVVVVYKVDRLSRSLLDFARLLEVFERQRVSFVSVTQQFNTAQSLGRLVLNMLLSFAQFEREMIAERTRDKMHAARKKGKWIGGVPPLGYDVAPGGGSLVVNEEEVAQVRAVFELYLQERSLMRVVELLNGRGWRTKSWQTKAGKQVQGARWEKSSVRKVLTNLTYTGKVGFGGAVYEGEHAGFIEPDVFQRVQALLGAGKRDPSRTGNKHGFLLRGLIRCTACGSVMTSTTSAPRGTPYRYYSCTQARRRGTGSCPVRAVSAAEIEAFVIDRIKDIGKDPTLLQETLRAAEEDRQRERPELDKEARLLSAELTTSRAEARRLVSALAAGGDTPSLTSRLSELDERAVQLESRLAEVQAKVATIDAGHIDPDQAAQALVQFDPVWDALVPRERASVLQLLIDRVDYDGKGGEVAITFRPTGLASLAPRQRAA